MFEICWKYFEGNILDLLFFLNYYSKNNHGNTKLFPEEWYIKIYFFEYEFELTRKRYKVLHHATNIIDKR